MEQTPDRREITALQINAVKDSFNALMNLQYQAKKIAQNLMEPQTELSDEVKALIYEWSNILLNESGRFKDRMMAGYNDLNHYLTKFEK